MNRNVLQPLILETPLVVTGAGSVSVAGFSTEALWRAVIAGRSTAHRLAFGDADNVEFFTVCRVLPMDLRASMCRPVRKMDRSVQMAWLAASEALEQSGVANGYAPERIGVAAGTSRGPIGKIGEALARRGRRRIPAPLATESAMGALSGVLAQAFNFQGPGATLSATCTSSAVAIAFAAEQILLGKADAMLVGGADALQPVLLAQLHAMGVLGHHEDPALACRPFDLTRNGLVPGEGSAFLVLESKRAATERGAAVLAQLTGWGTAVDHSGRAGVDPEGDGLVKVMRAALEVAGLHSEQIDHINTHGTGTVVNDEAEARAICRVFGDRSSVPCNSTKPVTGHCLGATPALEAVICIEALRHQMIPPTANCLNRDPSCRIHLPTSPVAADLRAVMSNSIGFWGYQACLIFSRSGETS